MNFKSITKKLDWAAATFLIEIWTPMNIRLGNVMNLISQVRLFIELFALGTFLFVVYLKINPNIYLSIAAFILIFGLALWGGDLMVRRNIQQRMADKSNQLNPAMNKVEEIHKWVKEIHEKLNKKE